MRDVRWTGHGAIYDVIHRKDGQCYPFRFPKLHAQGMD